MDQLDCVISTVGQGNSIFPIIACFYTGIVDPAFCAPMPREPLPPTGIAFDASFSEALVMARTLNPSVHDGAVMVGRSSASTPYRVTGWSYRLFPPEAAVRAEPNRGSAFNSCLLMSCIENIDRIYLISSRGITAFRHGTWSALSGG
jgi:hypothetical protein